MEAETFPLFAYGTLLDPQVQQLVFGRLVPGQPDSLPGFVKRERSVEGRYPEVIPDTGSGARVCGQRLYLEAPELARADVYETSLYFRELAVLESGMRAWVYRAARDKKQIP